MAAVDLTTPGSLPAIADVTLGSGTVRRINLPAAQRLRVTLRPVTSAAVLYFASSGLAADGEVTGTLVGTPLDADSFSEFELSTINSSTSFFGLSGTDGAHVRVIVEQVS